jgi:hypothetical protein
MLSHFVKDSKNGNLVGIQEIPFGLFTQKAMAHWYFCRPTSILQLLGSTSAPVESKS